MDVDISLEAINMYYRISWKPMVDYWRKEQRPNLVHMLQTLWENLSIARWSKRNGLVKTFMNKEARA